MLKSKCGRELRKTSWFVSAYCSCPYNHGGKSWKAVEFPDWLIDITESVMREVGWNEPITTMPNSCNANWYPQGNATVGWHSDNESLFKTRKNRRTMKTGIGYNFIPLYWQSILDNLCNQYILEK